MFEKLTPGQEIETTVVQVSGDTVFIDLNAKSEGVISTAEFTDSDGNVSVKVGDKIKVFYLGEKNGENRFTTKIAGESADDSILENAFKNHIPVEGHVEKEIKGGFEVTVALGRVMLKFTLLNPNLEKKDFEEIIREIKRLRDSLK